ncbi:hypothetical protein L9F63_002247 [Diploptera punctata]|uniref:FHA domain-containing protein n=1 Tax=Diploptera punctata TaxID=6984 RepID=A0AAD8A3C3_DIPPU|nr:hypothetical protein L9F63_002247 [Diploptera punctata]
MNLSRTTTLLNGKSIGNSTCRLEHGDVITASERSFRWEYPPESPFYINKMKKHLSPYKEVLGVSEASRRKSMVVRTSVESPERLIAVVSPLRRTQSEKKITGTRTPSSRTKARKSFANLMTSLKTPQQRSKDEKTASSARKMPLPESSKKTPLPALKQAKSKSEKKSALIQRHKRKLESDIMSAERAAKRLKMESPKTPDKNKMAALLVCHGKTPRAIVGTRKIIYVYFYLYIRLFFLDIQNKIAVSF